VTKRFSEDDAGVGGQTAIFHAVTQFDDDGLPATQLPIRLTALSVLILHALRLVQLPDCRGFRHC
jgi:hypothetical protein